MRMLKISSTNLQVATLNARVSQKELAAISGLPPAQISRLLNHGGKCRNATIYRLSAALNVPADYLVVLDCKGGD